MCGRRRAPGQQRFCRNSFSRFAPSAFTPRVTRMLIARQQAVEFPCFKKYPLRWVQRLCGVCELATLEAGEVVVTQGVIEPRRFIVLAGKRAHHSRMHARICTATLSA